MRWMAAVMLTLAVGCWGTVQANEAESLFQEAMQAAQADNYDTALAKFEAALQVDPNNLQYGNAYRLTVVKINQAKTYDRCTAFFQKLVADHPKASNAFLNFGYAYVDKIPVEGAITQVLLANKALGQFSAALALEESWLGLYTRGNSYVYWPAIFGRTPLAIADLFKLELRHSRTLIFFPDAADIGIDALALLEVRGQQRLQALIVLLQADL